jgi:hypothetical protein
MTIKQMILTAIRSGDGSLMGALPLEEIVARVNHSFPSVSRTSIRGRLSELVTAGQVVRTGYTGYISYTYSISPSPELIPA